MATTANPDPPSPGRRTPDQVAADEARLAAIAERLASTVEAVVPGWIERLVVSRVRQWRGDVPPDLAAEAISAGDAARDELGPVLRELLRADVDHQAVNPLELLRAVTGHAGAVLAAAGAPPVARDDFAERSFPEDVFGLMPATWADIDPELHEIGITWGAAKAYVHRARRRDEGQA